MCQKILFTGSFYNVLSNVHIPKHVIRFSMLWSHFATNLTILICKNATNLTLSPPFRRNFAKNGIAERSLLFLKKHYPTFAKILYIVG